MHEEPAMNSGRERRGMFVFPWNYACIPVLYGSGRKKKN